MKNQPQEPRSGDSNSNPPFKPLTANDVNMEWATLAHGMDINLLADEYKKLGIDPNKTPPQDKEG